MAAWPLTNDENPPESPFSQRGRLTPSLFVKGGGEGFESYFLSKQIEGAKAPQPAAGFDPLPDDRAKKITNISTYAQK